MSIWEKFDEQFDSKALAKDLESGATEKKFEKLPYGTYEVKIEKLELKVSSKGNPMLSVWFNVLEGDFKKKKIFINQVLTESFTIHIANTFLKDLYSGLEVKFESFKQYADLIMDIHEEIDGKYEYLLEFGQTSKGYDTFKIKDVYVVE